MTPQKPAETPWTTRAAIAVLVAVIVLGALFLGQGSSQTTGGQSQTN
jgi:hypothetical protein